MKAKQKGELATTQQRSAMKTRVSKEFETSEEQEDQTTTWKRELEILERRSGVEVEEFGSRAGEEELRWRSADREQVRRS